MSSPVDYFEKVEPLPTGPTILPKLLSALSNPDVNVDEVVNLVVHEPALAAKVLKLCKNNPAMLLALEKEHYHIDHAELGGALLERWNFPPTVVAAVRFHHSPGAAGDYNRLSGLITIADRLSYLLNSSECAELDVPGLQYAFDTFEFSPELQKAHLERLQGMLSQAEVMSL